jgi:RNA polymerase sigma-70 factor (ECF subfamily)
MASIATGDRDAFKAFLSRHLSAVIVYARRYLASHADAEDIAQETFIRVWQKAATWQPQGYSPRSWMYRIAYHLCIDEIRRRPTNEVLNDDGVYNPVDPESSSPEKTIENASDLNQLTHWLTLLPERQHTALSLCALQGLSNKEAATAMEISVDALESLLSRGRRQLRNHLQQDGENNYE